MDGSMKKQPIQIIVLEPDEGMILTNGETYSYRVYLGVNDSPNNWREIPESEMPSEDEQMPEEVVEE